jgi:hypothetical protein
MKTPQNPRDRRSAIEALIYFRGKPNTGNP